MAWSAGARMSADAVYLNPSLSRILNLFFDTSSAFRYPPAPGIRHQHQGLPVHIHPPMPPERRAITSPPRSPLIPSLPMLPDLVPNSYPSTALGTRQQHLHLRLQDHRDHPSLSKQRRQKARLQQAHQEFHRQRELYQLRLQQERHQLLPSSSSTSHQGHQEQHHHHHHHHHHHLHSNSSGPAPSIAGVAPIITFSTTTSTASPTSTPAPKLAPSHRFQPPHTHLQPPSHLHPPRPSPASGWSTIKERERTRVLTHMSSFRDAIPPLLSPQNAKDNLRNLSHRIQRRRARTRETILYDLHQGVRSVEAQVQKQVEMVLTKLRDAPPFVSKYAFGLTNSFLSEIPPGSSSTMTESDGHVGKEDDDDDEVEGVIVTNASRSLARPLPSSPDSLADDQLSTEMGTIALASSGIAEVLSASQYHSYSTAASQVLTAALPSFIPSIVAPLVCVFSYPSPTQGSAAMPDPSRVLASSSSSSSLSLSRSVSAPASTSALPPVSPFPWDDGKLQQSRPQNLYPFPQSNQDNRKGQPTPSSGIVVVHSSTWTAAEREALFLAATRFKLQGQWAKIRKVMNLHRSDQEIEAEFQRLYGERDDGDDPLSSDSSEDDPSESESDARASPNSHTLSICPARRRRRRRHLLSKRDMDGDADDEAEGTVFMKFGGTHHRTLQSSLEHGYGHLPLIDTFPLPLPSSASTSPTPRSSPHCSSPIPTAENPPPRRIFQKELMLDKRFALEEIPMRL